MILPILVISLGAVLGAVCCWLLSMQLKALFPSIPPGTLPANLIGRYLIGIAVALFAEMPGLTPEWRLFAITGFLGGLTTFSTFLAEVVSHLTEGRMLLALSASAAHVVGSLAMTLAGIGTVALVRSF